MAIARLESPLPPPGGDSSALGLNRDRPERELLALRRGGWVSSEQVQAIQYGFVLDAMTETAAELGYGHTSANEVIRRAKVSRRTFYELFPDLDQCFLAALHSGHDWMLQAARVGYAESAGGSWEARVRGSVTEVLALLDAQPAQAELCVVQGLAGPRAGVVAHRELIDRLATDLDASARQTGPRASVPARVSRALVSGAWMTIHDRLTDPSPAHGPLAELGGEIMYVLCAPFLSARRAERELHLPARSPLRDWAGPAPLPAEQTRWRAELAGSGTRKQVLRYLLEHPGASSLMVGEHLAANQSTTSRRLAKLSRDGLIVSQKRAGRHAWHVTERGHAAFAGGRPETTGAVA